MTKLLILCVDGLDPDFASENGFSMEYESKLSVPLELYKPQSDEPWTPFVWASIFAGRIEIDLSLYKTVMPLRLKIRRFLISHGIRWSRKGFKIYSADKPVHKLIYMPRTAENLVVDGRKSFLYHVPCVSYDYFYGNYPGYAESEWEQFNVFASFSRYLEKDIVALYTRIIDHKGHRYFDKKGDTAQVLREYYKQVFELVAILGKGGTVMVVSDHGTIGVHTKHAYLGCTEPIFATSILEVREDMERILGA